MKLNAAQHILLNELDTPYRLYQAGMGGGKSFTAQVAGLLHIGKYPGTDIAYFAPTFPLIEDIFYPGIGKVAGMLGFSVKINYAKKIITVYRGSIKYGTILCRTMEKPERIIGYEISLALVDEIDTMPLKKAMKAWEMIVGRLRLPNPDGSQNTAIVTTTPEGYNFCYAMFHKKPDVDYSLVQASTYENEEHLPDDYIDRLKRTYPDHLVKAYLMGEVVNMTSGAVYRSYDREKHRSSETVQGNEPIFVGMDFNIDRMAATVFVRRKNGEEWHAVDEIHKGYDTDYVCRTLKERYPNSVITVYPDASGGRRDTRGKGAATSDLTIIEKDYGFKISYKVGKKNPLVKDRVAATNAALEKGRLFINDEKCPNVADCLAQQCYDDNGQPVKDGRTDDQNDATTYAVYWEMPVIKPIRQIPVSFGGY